MSKDIKTLEQRLHATADQELKNEIERRVRPINELAGHGSMLTFPADKIRTQATSGADVFKVDTYFVLEALRAALYIDNVEERRQKAVDNFLNEVTELRERLNELEEGGALD